MSGEGRGDADLLARDETRAQTDDEELVSLLCGAGPQHLQRRASVESISDDDARRVHREEVMDVQSYVTRPPHHHGRDRHDTVEAEVLRSVQARPEGEVVGDGENRTVQPVRDAGGWQFRGSGQPVLVGEESVAQAGVELHRGHVLVVVRCSADHDGAAVEQRQGYHSQEGSGHHSVTRILILPHHTR